MREIPKKIHQVWIQDAPLPDKFKPCQKSWKAYRARGWEYKLWHGSEIRKMLQEHFPHTVKCYDTARSHSSRSNFARYVILYLYGGIYVDTDFKSVKNVDKLFQNAAFVVCRETQHQLCTCIIGSAPKHPILHNCLMYYQNKVYDPFQMSYLASGPVFFSKRFGEYVREHGQYGISERSILEHQSSSDSEERYSTESTDLFEITDVSERHSTDNNHLENTGRVIVYDTNVFLPLSFHGRIDMDDSDPSLQGAYTIHYWDFSWKKNIWDISTTNAVIIAILIVFIFVILVWGAHYTRCQRRSRRTL